MNKSKTLGCEWLNYGIYITPKKIFHCCSGNQKTNQGKDADSWSAPIAISNPNSDTYDTEFYKQIFDSKKDLLYKLNNNIECDCTDCAYLLEKKWEDRNNLRLVSVSADWTCNCNCYYCYQFDHSLKPDYDVIAFIKGLIDSNAVIKSDLSAVFWTGGEFTIAKHFEESFQLLDKYGLSSNFTSSGIVYNETVTKRLNELRNANITISIDSGTKETYKKVKRVDQFDKVLNTIKLYSQNVKNQSRIAIKYIILPENYSKQEIDSFFQLLIDNNLTKCSIILDIDLFQANSEPDNEIVASLYYFSMRLLQLQGRYPYIGYLLFRRFPWFEEIIDYNNSEITRRSFETIPFALSNYNIIRKLADIAIPIVFGKNSKIESLGKISAVIDIMKKIKNILHI